jgi:hypothetical protein
MRGEAQTSSRRGGGEWCGPLAPRAVGLNPISALQPYWLASPQEGSGYGDTGPSVWPGWLRPSRPGYTSQAEQQRRLAGGGSGPQFGFPRPGRDVVISGARSPSTSTLGEGFLDAHNVSQAAGL